MDNRARIAIVPAAEAEKRPRLFAALANAYPVDFVAGDDGAADAIVSFGADAPDRGRPSLRFGGGGSTGPQRAVSLAGSELLPQAIRGRRLDDASEAAPLALDPGWIPLASSDEGVLWAYDGDAALPRHRAAVAPGELGPSESLRDRFRDGEFMTLLPLVEFLRAAGAIPVAPLRAAFMLDDPNLHAMRYGYAAFPALAAHAREHRYHIAMATIPIDGWLARGSAVRLFNANRKWLSLLMHGNDHVHRELAQPRTPEASNALFAQALARIGALERRSGALVDRVMAPPHGAYSLVSAAAMLRVGFDALCANQVPVDADGTLDDAIRGWRPGDYVAGGLPVLPRYHLAQPRTDVVFRALLGQPIILYGHHQDLAPGLDVLADAAATVNSLGDVRWGTLGEVAQANYDTRLVDDTLHVRLFTRRARLDVPARARRVVVELPGHEAPDLEILRCAQGRDVVEEPLQDGLAAFALRGEGALALTLVHRAAIDPATVPAPRRRAWPLVRRLMTEGRDRLSPVLSR